MSLSRIAKRRDANEADIMQALELCGAYVVRLDTPCDLLVGFRSRWWLLEVKDGGKSASRRLLTRGQLGFRDDCRTHGLPFAVVNDASEALAEIGAVR
jgi:hypothetical protein